VDCIADHLCLPLDGRPVTGGQWSARCPAHDDAKRSLSLALGTRGQRIIWLCHAGCDPADVRKALLGKGVSARCVPWKPEPPPAAHQPSGAENVVAEIEKLLAEQPNPVDFMVRVGELIWDVDDLTAARRAGIAKTTFYRRRACRRTDGDGVA
jgi:hypothetical protein